MFTIEQSGHITKTNTIDGLINEYIKRYVDNYVIKGDSSNGNVGIPNGNGITEEQLNEAVNGLRDYVINNYALSTDIPEPVDLTNYALKSEIPEVLKNSELQLNIKELLPDEMFQKLMAEDDKPLSAKASMCLTSIAANEALQTALDSCAERYVPKEDLPEIIEGQTTIQFEIVNNTIPDLEYDKYHKMIEQYG